MNCICLFEVFSGLSLIQLINDLELVAYLSNKTKFLLKLRLFVLKNDLSNASKKECFSYFS